MAGRVQVRLCVCRRRRCRCCDAAAAAGQSCVVPNKLLVRFVMPSTPLLTAANARLPRL